MVDKFSPAQIASMKLLLAMLATEARDEPFKLKELGWEWRPTISEPCAIVDELDIYPGDLLQAAYSLLFTVFNANSELTGETVDEVIADMAMTLAMSEVF
jgi:hypothetical protein